MIAGPTIDDALSYAEAGWEVFPLRGKVPAVPRRFGGRGVLDATSDTTQIVAWWTRYPNANIGARVHPDVLVIDTDPRHGGEDNLAAVAVEHGGLPDTLTCFSGRGDGGRHRYYWRPAGTISSKRLPAGVDLKGHGGYAIVPPSVHPATGQPYRWAEPIADIVACPRFLAELICEHATVATPRPFRPRVVRDGDSIADWFNASSDWAAILRDWHEVPGGWRHPEATSALSATLRHDLLFVYSPNTPFEPTEAGSPHGYSRFRAWAVLEHGGDLSAAARHAKILRDAGQRRIA